MNRFTDKTVLVTGGNSGIGLATAIQYAREGARVIITGRDKTTLEHAKNLIGTNTISLQNDQGDINAAVELANVLKENGITLDAVFLNAGVAKFAPIQDIDESLWDQTFNVNVKGAFFTIKALTPLLNRNAAIVLNGSINAHIGMPSSSVYAASKAALISFAKTLSSELLPLGVRVNVVSPGPVSTPLYGRLGMDPAQLEQMAKAIQGQIPLNRFGTSEELAKTVLFMSSSDSAFIVGTELIADGGMSQL